MRFLGATIWCRPLDQEYELSITVDKALDILKQVPDSYRYTTLPCSIDDEIAKVVAFIVDATPTQRQEFYRRIDKDISYNLLMFAERMSMLSVRRESADLLLNGLIALAMTGPTVDYQFVIMNYRNFDFACRACSSVSRQDDRAMGSWRG
jgi:hypothetical protein